MTRFRFALGVVAAAVIAAALMPCMAFADSKDEIPFSPTEGTRFAMLSDTQRAIDTIDDIIPGVDYIENEIIVVFEKSKLSPYEAEVLHVEGDFPETKDCFDDNLRDFYDGCTVVKELPADPQFLDNCIQ